MKIVRKQEEANFGWLQINCDVSFEPGDSAVDVAFGFIESLEDIYKNLDKLTRVYSVNRFLVSEDVHLSESSFWELVIEAGGTESVDTIERYLDQLRKIADSLSLLVAHSSPLPAGAIAVFKLLEKWFFSSMDSSVEEANNIARVFWKYLSRVDLNHEVNEDRYILNYLDTAAIFNDQKYYTKILALRVSSGQWRLTDYLLLERYLSPYADNFRFVLEDLVALGVSEKRVYALIIAAVYGDDKSAMNDMFSYIEKQLGAELDEFLDDEYVQRCQRARRQALEEMAEEDAVPEDTEFHSYNASTGRWFLKPAYQYLAGES